MTLESSSFQYWQKVHTTFQTLFSPSFGWAWHSKQNSYCSSQCKNHTWKISRRGKGKQGIDVGSITIFTNKVIIPEGQDNEQSLGKKRKRKQSQYCSLKAGFALFLKVLMWWGKTKKSLALFWGLSQVVLKKPLDVLIY